jgi:hypothetical protein
MSSPVESMNEERAKASFNIRELTHLLDGGEKSTLVICQFGNNISISNTNDISSKNASCKNLNEILYSRWMTFTISLRMNYVRERWKRYLYNV